MEVSMMRCRVPAFGAWNHDENLPVSHYFGPASPAGLPSEGVRHLGGGVHLYPPHIAHYCYYGRDDGEDLFPVPPPPPPTVLVTAYPSKLTRRTTEKQQHKAEEKGQPPQRQDKEGKLCGGGVTIHQPPRGRCRAGMAVDEDLYEVPSKRLYRKPKRKKVLMGGFWTRCLCLNCIP